MNIDMLDFALDAYRGRSLDGVSSGSGHLADIVLIQCTGLKDQNGREIWEDDILGYTSDDRTISVVEFCDADHEHHARPALFRLHRRIYEDFAHQLHDVDDYIDDWWNESWVVIGTIYEHPHLLQSNQP